MYIDDIFFTQDKESEHLDMIEEILTHLRNQGIKINIKKSEIARFKVRYLDFSTDYAVRITRDLGNAQRDSATLDYSGFGKHNEENQITYHTCPKSLHLCTNARAAFKAKQKVARFLLTRKK